MLRKPRFNMSQPSFSTSMFLKNSGRTREREWMHVCIQNTGLVNYSSNVLTKQRRTREMFNEAHHNIRLYFRRTFGPCCQWGMNPFERAKPAPKRKGNWIQMLEGEVKTSSVNILTKYFLKKWSVLGKDITRKSMCFEGKVMLFLKQFSKLSIFIFLKISRYSVVC